MEESAGMCCLQGYGFVGVDYEVSSFEEAEADANYDQGKESVKDELRELIKKELAKGRVFIRLDILEEAIEEM